MKLESLPMLVEACFQNAGLVSMEIDGIESLPVGIQHVDIDDWVKIIDTNLKGLILSAG